MSRAILCRVVALDAGGRWRRSSRGRRPCCAGELTLGVKAAVVWALCVFGLFIYFLDAVKLCLLVFCEWSLWATLERECGGVGASFGREILGELL